VVYGSSATLPPNHPNSKKSNTNNQKVNLKNKLNLLIFTICQGHVTSIKIAPTIKRTPPNLSGTDLNIA